MDWSRIVILQLSPKWRTQAITLIYEVIGRRQEENLHTSPLDPGRLSRAPLGRSSWPLTASQNLSQWSAGTKRNEVQCSFVPATKIA